MQLKEWLGEGNQLSEDIWNRKYRHNEETLDEWFERVSGGNEKVKKLIQERKFLFGGRTLANRNTGKNATYSNCFSSGYVPDSLQGIMETNTNLALTYKLQGGQGLSLSKIRPKGTPIGNDFESDGIIPFMEIFNQTTASVSQGGSRKGALLMSLECDHKQIENFIDVKTKDGIITKANLSIEYNDEFMRAVHEYYKNGEVIEINCSKTYEGNVVEYTIKPIEIYKKAMQSAYDWAEPGSIFISRFRNYNLMQFVDEYEIVTGNVCGEQPLPKDGACNLGSINLSEYVLNPYTNKAEFDFDTFVLDVATAIEALDEVLDESKDLHPLENQRYMARNYRNIGLGIMGIADVFIKMGIKYGSQDSKELIDRISHVMFRKSVLASVEIAKQKGSFPKYSDKVFDSDIAKNHLTEEEIEEFKKIGIRNCSLISLAPAGTIGTMLGVSTGIEPFYQISYRRKTESLHKEEERYYDVFINVAKEYMKKNNTDKLPDYFVTANEIKWKDRVDIQAIVQNHVDTAISSTVNLPKNTSVADVEKLCLYGWLKGLKGLTVFKEGCKREGILTTSDQKEKKKDTVLEWGTTIQCTDDLIGLKRRIFSGCGSIHVLAWFDPSSGKLMEIYLSKGSDGGCLSWMTGSSRIISAAMRTGMDFDYLIDQLKSAPSCPSYAIRSAVKKDTSKGNCCPAAVANALIEMQKEVIDQLEDVDEEIEEVVEVEIINGCPECGEELAFEGGCFSCKNCHFSRCE